MITPTLQTNLQTNTISSRTLTLQRHTHQIRRRSTNMTRTKRRHNTIKHTMTGHRISTQIRHSQARPTVSTINHTQNMNTLLISSQDNHRTTSFPPTSTNRINSNLSKLINRRHLINTRVTMNGTVRQPLTMKRSISTINNTQLQGTATTTTQIRSHIRIQNQGNINTSRTQHHQVNRIRNRLPRHRSVNQNTMKSTLINTPSRVTQTTSQKRHNTVSIHERRTVASLPHHNTQQSRRQSRLQNQITNSRLNTISHMNTSTSRTQANRFTNTSRRHVTPSPMLQMIKRINTNNRNMTMMNTNKVNHHQRHSTIRMTKSNNNRLNRSPAVNRLIIRRSQVANILNLTKPTRTNPRHIINSQSRRQSPKLIRRLSIRITRHSMIIQSSITSQVQQTSINSIKLTIRARHQQQSRQRNQRIPLRRQIRPQNTKLRRPHMLQLKVNNHQRRQLQPTIRKTQQSITRQQQSIRLHRQLRPPMRTTNHNLINHRNNNQGQRTNGQSHTTRNPRRRHLRTPCPPSPSPNEERH